MGCDIHGVIEVRLTHRDAPEKGPQWFCVSPLRTSVYRDGDAYWTARDGEANLPDGWDWLARNYQLFAVLADVRNDYGITPIAEPRGMPKDASQEARDVAKRWSGDGHSHSWVTWREVAEHPLAKEHFMRRLLNAMRYACDVYPCPDEPSDDVRIVFFFDN